MLRRNSTAAPEGTCAHRTTPSLPARAQANVSTKKFGNQRGRLSINAKILMEVKQRQEKSIYPKKKPLK